MYARRPPVTSLLTETERAGAKFAVIGPAASEPRFAGLLAPAGLSRVPGAECRGLKPIHREAS